MTARNVRAYQTRGLLQPPGVQGRVAVYGADTSTRLLQVQQARSRGASLRLLRTLIARGPRPEGVWDERPPGDMVDVRTPPWRRPHTADCLARRRLPLAPLLGPGADRWTPPVRRCPLDAGVLRVRRDGTGPLGPADAVRRPGGSSAAPVRPAGRGRRGGAPSCWPGRRPGRPSGARPPPPGSASSRARSSTSSSSHACRRGDGQTDASG